MRSGGDARRPVNVDPDVVVVGGERFAGVDSNSYAQRALGQSALTLIGRFEGIGRTGEHVEECVSLRVDFGAATFAELGAENPSMLGENAGVLVTEIVEERRGALDVSEEERDCAGRQGAHTWDHRGSPRKGLVASSTYVVSAELRAKSALFGRRGLAPSAFAATFPRFVRGQDLPPPSRLVSRRRQRVRVHSGIRSRGTGPTRHIDREYIGGREHVCAGQAAPRHAR